MTWYEITLAVAGAFGGLEFIKWLWGVIFNRKNNSRIENTKATNAEIEVAKNKAIAEAEAKKAAEDAHAIERHQYEERIADLHKTIDKLNEQLDGYVTRDAAKEKRFDEQTQKLRDVQGKLYESAKREIEYEKRIGHLELELEKKRCDDLPCPFRQPPNAHTQAKTGVSREAYFQNRKHNDTADSI